MCFGRTRETFSGACGCVEDFLKSTFKGITQFIGAFLILTATLISPQVSSGAQVKPVRRVLIFHELGLSSPAETLLDQQIVGVLENLPFQIELYREYLEANLFHDPTEQQEIRKSFLHRYRERKLDLIIALGMHPLDFIADVHERAFKGVPIVFGGVSVDRAGSLNLDSHFTGVWESFEPEKTLEVALRLQPGTRHVVVVGGKTDFDLELEARFQKHLRSYEPSLDIKYITDLPMPELLGAVSHLPPNTVVLMTHVGLDAAGTSFVGASQADPIVLEASNAPVFGPSDVDLGHGEVGGYLDSFALEGRNIGQMATRILGGESPKDIPIVTGANVYMFDWRALRRWGFSESNLPPGSIVLNRQPTVWESFKWYIAGGVCLLLVQTSLIIGLLWERANRRKAEAELAFTYDRLRLAVETGKAVGWDWDIKTGQDRWFGDLQTVFGISSDAYCGRVEDFSRRVHPEDKQLVSKAVADARENRKPYAAEFRVIRDDETVRWLTARGNFYYANNGDAERMLGMSVDITDRKLAEQQVRESQNRLAAIVSSAMDAIITIDEEQRIILFNPAAEKIFGCSAGDAIGSSVDRFIPERFRADHRVHIRRFSESAITNRVMGGMSGLRTNGEEFPIESSISQIQPGGAKLYTVTVRDITDRVRAEEAIRESEQRFRLVANTAPVMIWTTGTDKLCDYVNKPWLDFTGRTIEQELGNGWAEGIHSEDVDHCLRTYREAFDNREQFEMEYRLRSRDGEYRWIFDRGVPRFNADWTFAGYIGCCIDVTDRKRAEEALSTIGRRLIEAHEEERTWIGRELHDDINQRLALLAVELDQWSKEQSRSTFYEHLSHAQSRITEISKDVQALSHRLHSSKLDYLGLTSAARSFCKELSDKAKVEVQFSHSAVPSTMPKEVSLCLFRVLQEALQNAIKYSGIRLFRVDLQGTPDGIELTVSDDGIGFDETEEVSRQGLGLISMRERLQMVHGVLKVKTHQGAGTTISARVPLQMAELRAKAG